MSNLVDPKDVPQLSTAHRVMIWLFGMVIVLGGFAFGFKLYEFFQDLSQGEGLQFAGSHLLTYCLVAAGFLLLLVFAFLRGHFTDIELPKFETLEREKNYDRQEFGI